MCVESVVFVLTRMKIVQQSGAHKDWSRKRGNISSESINSRLAQDFVPRVLFLCWRNRFYFLDKSWKFHTRIFSQLQLPGCFWSWKLFWGQGTVLPCRAKQDCTKRNLQALCCCRQRCQPIGSLQISLFVKKTTNDINTHTRTNHANIPYIFSAYLPVRFSVCITSPNLLPTLLRFMACLLPSCIKSTILSARKPRQQESLFQANLKVSDSLLIFLSFQGYCVSAEKRRIAHFLMAILVISQRGVMDCCASWQLACAHWVEFSSSELWTSQSGRGEWPFSPFWNFYFSIDLKFSKHLSPSFRFMMFMVALAVGTLAGSGILVLIPEV